MVITCGLLIAVTLALPLAGCADVWGFENVTLGDGGGASVDHTSPENPDSEPETGADAEASQQEGAPGADSDSSTLEAGEEDTSMTSQTDERVGARDGGTGSESGGGPADVAVPPRLDAGGPDLSIVDGGSDVGSLPYSSLCCTTAAASFRCGYPDPQGGWTCVEDNSANCAYGCPLGSPCLLSVGGGIVSECP
jgi:hypothetical protein